MEKLGKFIIRHKILIIVIFVLLIIPSFMGMIKTETNYNLLTYLPDEFNSKQGQEILDNDFGVGKTVYLLVHDKELWDIKKLKEDILKIEGIDKVNWIDDFASITVPLDFIPNEIKENFISGKSTILHIQLKEINSLASSNAIEQVKELLDNNSAFSGQPVILQEFRNIVSKEVTIFLLVVALVVLIILSLSTASIIEPILLLFSLGIAIFMNMGTNIFRGEISYITFSVAAVMQLAVSMDYSIFLVHRYHEEKKIHPNKEIAMISAIKNTSISVSGSALTTIAGFSALMIMKMGMGKDMGFVLAKGIVFSLITTLILLPSLLLVFDKLITRTKHRLFLPKFDLVSKWIVKFKWVFLIILIIIIVPSFLAQRNLDYYYTIEKMLSEDASSIKDSKKIREEFEIGEIIYVITPTEDRIKEKEMLDKIKLIPAVSSVNSLSELIDPGIPDTFIPDDIKDQFNKSGYSYATIQLSTGREDEDTREAISQIRNIASGIYEEYFVTGETVLTNDMPSVTERDLINVNLLSMGLIALILAIYFRSISIPIILILIIEVAIWSNLGILYFSNRPVSFMAPIFLGSIQLGATIDYAILFTSRYRENLQKHFDRESAIRQTIKTTGRSILTSALILFATCMTISLITSMSAVDEFIFVIGRGALISTATVLLGLPSMFLIFDKVIRWTTIGWPGKPKDL